MAEGSFTLSHGWTTDLYGLGAWMRDLQEQVVLPRMRRPENNAAPEVLGLGDLGDEDPDPVAGDEEPDDDDADEPDDEEPDDDVDEDEDDDGLAGLVDAGEDPFASLGSEEGTGADGIDVYSGKGALRTKVGSVRFTPDLGVNEIGIEGVDQIRALYAEIDRILASVTPSGVTTLTLSYLPMLRLTTGQMVTWTTVTPFTSVATRQASMTAAVSAPRFVDTRDQDQPVRLESPPIPVPDRPSASPVDVMHQGHSSIDLMERPLTAAEVDLTEHGAVYRMLKVALESGDRVSRLLAGQLQVAMDRQGRDQAALDRLSTEQVRLRSTLEGRDREVAQLQAAHAAAIERLRLEQSLEVQRLKTEHAMDLRQREVQAQEAALRQQLEQARQEVVSAKRKTFKPTGNGDSDDGMMDMLKDIVIERLGIGGDKEDGTEVSNAQLLKSLRSAPPQKVATAVKLMKKPQRSQMLKDLAKQDVGLAIGVIEELTKAVEDVQSADGEDDE